MKRLLRYLTGLTILTLNMGAAVYAVLLTAPGRGRADWAVFLANLGARRWMSFGAAIAFFLLWLLYFWTWRSNRPRERFLTIDGDQGPVSISTLAITDFLIRLAAEFPSIVRIEPRVIPRRQRIDILMNVRVKAGTQVNEMCNLLQQRVRQSLIDEMGIPDVDRIKVNIAGIVGEHRVL